ncbi:MAG: hypothetical protein IJU95_03170, partial [Treponema sp.]|nr:hypothetical protein [Treponema sp.]
LFIKKKTLAKSADIIAVCAAIILLSSLDMTFSIGKHQMCMCYFCLVLFTSTYHLINLKGERPFTSNLIAFTALTVYFFWMAAFVMKLNLPAVSVSSFLLLFEAVCRFRASKIDNAKEKHAILVFSRVLTAIWMLAALFIAENETAMTVYDKDSMPFQAVSCILIVLLATILFILSHGWKDSLDIILIHAAILLLCAWSEHYPFTVFSLESKFLLLFTAASVYAFVRIRIYGHSAYLPYMAVFVIGIVFILYRFTGRFFLGSPLVPLFTGLYYYGKENVLAKKTKGAQSGTVIWEVLCAVFILASSLTDRNFDHSGPLWHYGGTAAYISVYLSMLFCVLLILLPAIALLQKRIMCNYLLLVYSVTLLVCDAIWLSTGRHGISSVMSFVSFACVFLLAGYYIWEAYTEGKLAKANVAACYAALALVIKFFSDDYGFVAKGILFIALGIAMLLLNIFLYKTERQKKTAEEANGNE